MLLLFLTVTLVGLTLGQSACPSLVLAPGTSDLWQGTIDLPPGDQEGVIAVTFNQSVDKVTMTLRSKYDVTGASSQPDLTETEDHQTFFTNLSPTKDGKVTIEVKNVLAVAAQTIKLNGEVLCGREYEAAAREKHDISNIRNKRMVACAIRAPPRACRRYIQTGCGYKCLDGTCPPGQQYRLGRCRQFRG